MLVIDCRLLRSSKLVNEICFSFFFPCTITFLYYCFSMYFFFWFLHACTCYTNYSVRIIEFMPVIASYPPQRCELPHRLRSYKLQHLGGEMPCVLAVAYAILGAISLPPAGAVRAHPAALQCHTQAHTHTCAHIRRVRSSVVFLILRVQM